MYIGRAINSWNRELRELIEWETCQKFVARNIWPNLFSWTCHTRRCDFSRNFIFRSLKNRVKNTYALWDSDTYVSVKNRFQKFVITWGVFSHYFSISQCVFFNGKEWLLTYGAFKSYLQKTCTILNWKLIFVLKQETEFWMCCNNIDTLMVQNVQQDSNAS